MTRMESEVERRLKLAPQWNCRGEYAAGEFGFVVLLEHSAEGGFCERRFYPRSEQHPTALESKMHTNGTLRIGIVGGSLGGLFAAALLRMDGHQVRIYERSVTGLAGRGAGLVGQRDIFAILRAVGCEHVAHVGVVALERITFDRDGGVAHRQATPQMQISWDHLYRAFRALVARDDYVLGHAVRSVRQTDEFASLDFEG